MLFLIPRHGKCNRMGEYATGLMGLKLASI